MQKVSLLDYAESHESDPKEIGHGFKKLEEFLHTLPLDDNNAGFNLCCRLCRCSAYERTAFLGGVRYSLPAADVLTFAAALFVIISTYKELNAGNGLKNRRKV